MTIKIKRLFHGYASIRDYQAKEAIDNHEDLIIECRGEFMKIPYKEIGSGALSQLKFQSKHTSEQYYLLDFPWRPQMIQEYLL